MHEQIIALWAFMVKMLNDILVLGIATVLACLVCLFLYDTLQTKSALRRNYPIIAHFRYFFEHLGTFFRQYFFAMDREEMPFNRAQRSWVYRASKNLDNTVPFGSTRDLNTPGSTYFVNCMFPTLEDDAIAMSAVTIGAGSDHPYTHMPIFNISGMSYGALSAPAVRSLSGGAKQAGIWLNTGEGGISPYHTEGDCDLVFQIGTAKFGVRKSEGGFCEEKLKAVAKNPNVKMFEIKLSQGAKPGKGGILPAKKVTKEVAEIRGIKPKTAALSPNRHPELNNLNDVLDMVAYVRATTGKPVGFKTVVGEYEWLEELCNLIHQRGLDYAPDFIAIDSADGGTGAAPMSLIDYMGVPIHESLPLTIDAITRGGLRDRIKIIASGKLITPSDVAWAVCAGADFVTSARGFMFSMGCIQALHCHNNTCPTGITTHNARLQRGLNPAHKVNRVAQYALNIRKELNVIAHSCGVKEARLLRREHVRIMTSTGRSISMADLFPYQES